MTRYSIPFATIREVLDRDKDTCQVCGKVGTRRSRGGRPAVVEYLTERGEKYDGNESKSFELHHKIPVVFGGSNLSGNLELRCRSCNRSEKWYEMAKKAFQNTTS